MLQSHRRKHTTCVTNGMQPLFMSMFKVYPAYSLCDRRKTLTGSPDPTYMQPTNKPCINTLISPNMFLSSNGSCTGADTGFPVGGGADPMGGAPTYDFVKFSEKLHEIEKLLGRGGGAPPPQSAAAVHPAGTSMSLPFCEEIRKF